MKINSNSKVKEKFDSYPKTVISKMKELRNLVLETAKNTKGIQEVEETLKWGEPSYLVKDGSTIRMDWKEKNPNQIAIYFKCTSKLVPTFKSLYGNQLNFEGNRAIIFQLEEDIPKEKISNCIALALQYHKLKNLPLLGSMA
jgi:hypothetical protein